MSASEIHASDGTLLAIVIWHHHHKDGIEFFTDDSCSQQLGYMKRPAGYMIQPHIHNEVPRAITQTSEALFIRSGAVKVKFFKSDKTRAGEIYLSAGDVILLINGGHGFEMLSETEIIEVKQGPYVGGADKTRFEP